MNCIDQITCGERSIIGIRDYVECANPESGLFINNLPGISLRIASNVASEEHRTGKELLKNCLSMAARHVYDEFISQLKPYFNFSAIVETRELNVFGTQEIPAEAAERGIILKRWRSEMARIYVKELYIKVFQSGTITITLTDGCDTETYEAEVSADCVNIVPIDYVAESEQVKITFDQTSFSVGTTEYNQMSSGCFTCSGGRKGLTVVGWDGTKETGKSYGIGVYAEVRCYEANIFCNLLPRMYFLMWYKAGIVFLEEFIHSSRINHMTIYGKDEAKELLKNYETKYAEKYDVLIKSAYEYLKTTKGECIICNGNRYVESTP